MTTMTRLLAPLALIGLAATSPALAQTDIGNLTPEERTAFRAEVRAYLMENPEVLFEAIELLEAKRNEAAAVADSQTIGENADALFDDGYSFVGGNPEGDITMVEFLDYRCGYCKKAHPDVQDVLEQDGNIRYVVKEFPILGPESVVASRMAMAALEVDPSKYAELHDALMSHEGQLPEEAAYRIARDVGYDTDALKEAAKDETIDQRIKQNYELAAKLGIQGTPSFVIGDTLVRGYIPADGLLATIEEQRERASN